jgi:hypothetical protein
MVQGRAAEWNSADLAVGHQQIGNLRYDLLPYLLVKHAGELP